MNQLITKGIILTRTDYGEADRIVTLLTPDFGKLRLMVRGVRKMKSRLAGGIELFSVSDLTFIRGRGDLGTLISARLQIHYGNIVKDIDRVQMGYELIKLINKVTEDEAESDYFTMLEQAFAALDNSAIDLHLVRCWFQAQMLKFGGSTPNLVSEADGSKLEAAKHYNFDIEDMVFTAHTAGRYDAADIKFLRLLFSDSRPGLLAQVQDSQAILAKLEPLLNAMKQQHLHVE